jgi:hypothetical protein
LLLNHLQIFVSVSTLLNPTLTLRGDVRVLVGLGFASLNCSPSLSLLDYLDSKFVLLYKQPIEATINTR